MFLNPKPSVDPPMPQQRPHIGAIFGPNITCMLLHVFTSRPEAGETMRGYLHGGVILDLIGQKGPTSKLHLVLLDILVFILQCFILTVYAEREKISVLLETLSKPVVDVASGAAPHIEMTTGQEIGLGEQELVQSVTQTRVNTEPLAVRPDTNDMDTVRDGHGHPLINEELERLLADNHPPPEEEDDDATTLDAFYTDTGTLADFFIVDAIRHQYA
jgi:hypothetical protein